MLRTPITCKYRHVFHRLEEDHIQIFFEDNYLQDCPENRDYLLSHFKYFNFLHHIYAIHTQLPLYLNHRNPTPYNPTVPPRVFTEPFPNLNHLWTVTTREIKDCFAYAPHNTSKTKPSYRPKIFQNTFNSCVFYQEKSDRVRNFIMRHGFKFQNEIWLDIDGILYPCSMPSAVYLLRRYSSGIKNSVRKNEQEIKENTHNNRISARLAGIEVLLPELTLT